MNGYENLMAALVKFAVRDYYHALIKQSLTEIKNTEYFLQNAPHLMTPARKKFQRLVNPTLEKQSTDEIGYFLDERCILNVKVKSGIEPPKNIKVGSKTIPVRKVVII